MAQNREKWWDVEKKVMNFPFHIGRMCDTPNIV